MTQTQRWVGLTGVIIGVALLLYPPWQLSYEGGYYRVVYAYLFWPPDSTWTHRVGDKSLSPQTTGIAYGMLLGEIAAVVVFVGFLIWLYRPLVTQSPSAMT